ncbi:hypothetical protein HID58_034356 [Brassica napus]|uniref:Uncharacterized protein n=1 Tax=Brassica napus TaxID=3708 RepID=A0ABQ8C3F9_BRANA|nr:hypothetical protein HID58_034356 [Brassica napus]
MLCRRLNLVLNPSPNPKSLKTIYEAREDSQMSMILLINRSYESLPQLVLISTCLADTSMINGKPTSRVFFRDCWSHMAEAPNMQIYSPEVSWKEAIEKRVPSMFLILEHRYGNMCQALAQRYVGYIYYQDISDQRKSLYFWVYGM